MKCIHCNSEVSMWATVCPHCYRKPGNIIENFIIRTIRFFFFGGIIIYGILSLFIGGSGDKSTPQISKQAVKTQEHTVQNVTKTETTTYQNNNEYEQELTTQQQIKEREQRLEQQRQEQLKRQQLEEEKMKNEAENALF